MKVADVDYNTNEIIKLIDIASDEKVRLLLFPELCLTGYTSADLFFHSQLLDACLSSLAAIAKCTKGKGMIVIVSLPFAYNAKLYNVAAILYEGEILALIPKQNLPTYSEFYESRWFTPAFKGIKEAEVFGKSVPFGQNIIVRDSRLKEFALAVEICEDLWVPNSPSTSHAVAGATIIANPSASDEVVGKAEYRKSLVSVQSAKLIAAYLYADASEGESSTDMVFASHNMIAENGALLAEQCFNPNELLITEVDVKRLASERMKATTYPASVDEDYFEITITLPETETALTRHFSKTPFVPSSDVERNERAEKIIHLQSLGLKKRLEHTKAKSALVGLSGGLDSTLALLVTVRAFDMLLRDRREIIAVTMPCFGTTRRTRSNAEKLAVALGVSFREIDITESVRQHFKDIGQSESEYDVTYENAQARERTQVLMDIANKTGGLVIGTGDLSELALGWATYNGDHMSMYAVNASIPKTLVRYLVRWFADADFSSSGAVLTDILATPVSPELLPASRDGTISQRTEDIVGPYELHDFFLYWFVRQSYPVEKIKRIAYRAFEGDYAKETINKWLKVFVRRFFAQQFKRSCLPDGPKVGTLTLSPRSDWRMSSDASAEPWNK